MRRHSKIRSVEWIKQALFIPERGEANQDCETRSLEDRWLHSRLKVDCGEVSVAPTSGGSRGPLVAAPGGSPRRVAEISQFVFVYKVIPTFP